MKIFLHTYSLAMPILSGELALERVPALAARHGFEGVEWLDRLMPPYKAKAWEALARAQQEAGLESAALSMGLEMRTRTSRVGEQIKRAEKVLKLAQVLKVESVRLGLGGGGPLSISRLLSLVEGLHTRRGRNKRPLGKPARGLYRKILSLIQKGVGPGGTTPSQPDGWLLQSSAWALASLAKQADGLGMRLGVENHPGLTHRLRYLKMLLQLAGKESPGGVCLDLGNFSGSDDPLEACRQLAPQAMLVHFKLGGPDPAAYGQKHNYPQMLHILREAGYDGIFSMEYEGAGDGLALAAQGAHWLREHWEEGR